MSDKYITLSAKAAQGLLNQWRSDSTKLFLRLSVIAGVSFTGPVKFVAPPDFPLTVRFSCGEGAEIGLSLLDFEFVRTSSEEPRRWLTCRCESGLRFVLEVEGETLDDDPVLISALAQ
jgi:hypothetical protein